MMSFNLSFLRPVDNWSKPMQKEFTQRIYTDKTINEIRESQS